MSCFKLKSVVLFLKILISLVLSRNLINNQQNIDKIYLYAKDPYEATHQHLINKREKVGSDNFKDLRAFIEYSNDMQDVSCVSFSKGQVNF